MDFIGISAPSMESISGAHASIMYVNPPDAISPAPLSLEQTVTVNGTTWYAVAVIEVTAPGRYQLLCESDAPAAQQPTCLVVPHHPP